MADSRVEARNIQNEPQDYLVPESKELLKLNKDWRHIKGT